MLYSVTQCSVTMKRFVTPHYFIIAVVAAIATDTAAAATNHKVKIAIEGAILQSIFTTLKDRQIFKRFQCVDRKERTDRVVLRHVQTELCDYLRR